MGKLRLRRNGIPPSITGVVAVNQSFQPRFWGTVWSDWIMARVGPGSRADLVGSVERLYRHADEHFGPDSLDVMLGAGDMVAIEEVLGGYLASLRNRSAIEQSDHGDAWKTVLRFVSDTLDHMSGQPDFGPVEAKLERIERLYHQLVPARPRPPAVTIRALPAVVIEDLYDLFNPQSERNPFKTEGLRWRNFLAFLLLLHLGIRRGELLILRANAAREEFDGKRKRIGRWIDILETSEEEHDPRFTPPSIKTPQSKRQLPLSDALATLINNYAAGYRGRPLHPFLFNSQKNAPLAMNSLNSMFGVVSRHLSDPAKEALRSRRGATVSPHDLRHTSAVHRLAAYREAGIGLDEAVEKLRVFFGWSRSSEMPRKYARAYFESTMNDVWDESFDSFVQTVRRVGETA